MKVETLLPVGQTTLRVPLLLLHLDRLRLFEKEKLKIK